MSDYTSVKLSLPSEMKEALKETSELTGQDMSAIMRQALADTDYQDVPTDVWGKRENLIETNKPVMARAMFRNNVWQKTLEYLEADARPTVEEFEAVMDSYRKEAVMYDDRHADRRKDFVLWCEWVYTCCGRYPESDLIQLIFYLPESGDVPGGDETCYLAYDALKNHGNIPEKYLIREWDAATKMAQREEWVVEWDEKVQDMEVTA